MTERLNNRKEQSIRLLYSKEDVALGKKESLPLSNSLTRAESKRGINPLKLYTIHPEWETTIILGY